MNQVSLRIPIHLTPSNPLLIMSIIPILTTIISAGELATKAGEVSVKNPLLFCSFNINTNDNILFRSLLNSFLSRPRSSKKSLGGFSAR